MSNKETTKRYNVPVEHPAPAYTDTLMQEVLHEQGVSDADIERFYNGDSEFTVS